MNIFKELFQTIVLYMCISFPVSAETSKVFISENPDVLTFRAPINAASYYALTTLYKTHKFKQINITSPGGDYDVGMQIAKFVYENRLSVYVPTYCASACTFAFFAAATDKRDMADEAIIGLHNISFETSAVNPNKVTVTVAETMSFAREVAHRTGVMMALYSSNGVPGDVLLEVAAKHGSDIVNIQRQDFVAWGTINPHGNENNRDNIIK